MPKLKTDSELLGTCGAARYLEVHRSTLESWRRRGEITPEIERGPRGPMYRYSEEALAELKEKIDYEA